MATVGLTHASRRMMRSLIAACALMMLVVMVAPARANAVAEARIGLLDHATRVTTSGIETGADVNLEVLFKPGIVPFHIPFSPYVTLGTSFNTGGHDTDQLYGGLTWEAPLFGRFFTRFGGGLAVHDGAINHAHDDQRTLGQRVLLRGTIEFGRRFGTHNTLAIVYDHISNGPFGGPNQGVDDLGVRYGYRF